MSEPNEAAEAERIRAVLQKKVENYYIAERPDLKRRQRNEMTLRKCRRYMLTEAGYGSVPLFIATWVVLPLIRMVIWEMARRLFDKLNDRPQRE